MTEWNMRKTESHAWKIRQIKCIIQKRLIINLCEYEGDIRGLWNASKDYIFKLWELKENTTQKACKVLLTNL